MIAHFHIYLIALFGARSCLGNVVDKSLAESTADFAIEFTKVTSGFKAGNFVFSPFSLTLMLAVLQQGARGNTVTQLNNALGLNPSQCRRLYRSTINYMQRSMKPGMLSWGTNIYIRPDFAINPKYLENLKMNYNVNLEKIRFDHPGAYKRINEWARNVTSGNVKDVIEPVSFSAATVMMLVSTFYFTENWANKFNEADNEEGEFFVNEEESVTVPFMVQRNLEKRLGEDSRLGARWLLLRYSKVSSMSMLLVMPTRRFKLDALLKKLNGYHILQMMNEEHTNMTVLHFPKFKASQKYSLPGYLKMFGITDIFSERADLGKIARAGEPLYVSAMFHESHISVNEKGTSATASTSVSFQFLSGSLEYPGSAKFRLDEPFLFFVFDMTRKLVLFAGRVNDPSKK